MKICYVGDGKSIHVYRWMDYFQKQGHQTLLLTDYPCNFPDINHKIIGNKQGNKILHYLKCVRDIKREIKSFQPDILHAHFLSGYGYWAQMSGFHPLVLTAWGSDIYIIPQKKAMSKRLTKKALEQADLVTADSQDLKSEILKLSPQTKRVELIIFGVDTQLFKPLPMNELNQRPETRDQRPVLLSTRRLEPNYNIENIIRATSLMKREFQNIKLIILGDGTQKQNLQQLSQSLGLNDNIEFRGEVDHSELLQCLQTADVFISVPFSDATSVSLLEAMSCELPVVVSDLPSNREWVEQDTNGKLVMPESVDVLARATLEILRNPDTAKLMGQTNRQSIISRAEFTTQMQIMEKHYQFLVSSS